MDESRDTAPVAVPRYRQIAEDIRQAIRDGRYKPREKLPSRKQLAGTYDVSTGTVDLAMTLLAETRWVEGHPGMGTFVASNPPR